MARSLPEQSVPAVQRGHEISDPDVTYVHWFSLGIVLLLIVTAAMAFALLNGFRIPQPATRPVPAAEGSVPVAALQSTPQEDLRVYRRAKSAALEGYRWIDRGTGVVQIPIERAMDLIAAEHAAPQPTQSEPALPPPPARGRTR
jgi:hypothetical protein